MGAGLMITGSSEKYVVVADGCYVGPELPNLYRRLYRDQFKGIRILCHEHCQCPHCSKWRTFLIRPKANLFKWLSGRIKCLAGIHDFSGQGAFKSCVSLGLMSDQPFAYGISICDRCHQILAVKQCM